MTKVLAVAGSARRNGNSDALLEKALEGIREAEPGAEIETLIPYQLSIAPCRACDGCFKTGRCVVKDQMQEIYPRFEACDHLVVASPLYFTSVPGHLKVLIDRFQCYWARRTLLEDPPQPRRSGMFLCVGAMDRRRYYESTLTLVKTWMMELNMACAVSRFYPGLDDRKDVQTRADYLEDARQAGIELIRSARQEKA
ncbi:MAG: flavodoxin family protein [Candidatus Brocadiia bacterium]|jgi:multimeric flavodoxin WrbA|nr:flavodoxin family protein [Candidatus Brocadiia bacterium]